jgi:hypothetical protein
MTRTAIHERHGPFWRLCLGRWLALAAAAVLIGGCANGTEVRTTAETDETGWRAIPDPPFLPIAPAFAASGDHVFIFGGHLLDGQSSTIVRDGFLLDRSSGEWQHIDGPRDVTLSRVTLAHVGPQWVLAGAACEAGYDDFDCPSSGPAFFTRANESDAWDRVEPPPVSGRPTLVGEVDSAVTYRFANDRRPVEYWTLTLADNGWRREPAPPTSDRGEVCVTSSALVSLSYGYREANSGRVLAEHPGSQPGQRLPAEGATRPVVAWMSRGSAQWQTVEPSRSPWHSEYGFELLCTSSAAAVFGSEEVFISPVANEGSMVQQPQEADGIPLSEFAKTAFVIGDEIYAWSGGIGLMFDALDQRWTTFPPPPQTTGSIAVAAGEAFVYFSGAIPEWPLESRLYSFKPAANADAESYGGFPGE